MTGPVPPEARHPLASALDAAEMLTARGWVVFPADHPDAGLHCTGSARRCVERRCGAQTDPRKRGKHPRVQRWGGLGVAGTAQLAAWFADDAGLPANVALACGPSGLFVVDEDTDGALAAYAASIGEVVPATFRVRTGRGWHWYFLVPTDPATGQRYRIGNSPGALGAWGCDVRGGASDSAEHGGYVITAGSRHWSGITYTADEPYAAAVEAPGWLISAVLAPYAAPAAVPVNGAVPVDGGECDGDGAHGTGGAPPGGSPATVDRPAGGSQGGARWDKATRYGSAGDLWAQYRRHCAEVMHTGAEFRHELFRAARDGWRLVLKDQYAEASMLDDLAECVGRVWHAEPDDRDSKIVYEEALDGPSGALASPWEVIEPVPPIERREITPGQLFTRPGDVIEGGLTSADTRSVDHTSGQHAVSDVTEGERLTADEQDYAKELRRQRFAQRAREELQAEKQDPLLEVDLDEWLDAPGPEWLVPGMLYRNGLAVVFGAPGAAKSFLALDIGLSFATGRPWIVGDCTVCRPDGSRGITHYVMAEGRDTNALRTNAWLIHHKADRNELREHFRLWDRAVQLTEPGIQEYLVAVRRDKPDLIIFDTKNLMFVGKESQGEDYGAMLRILHIIRQEADGCCIVLIDHTGLNAAGRVRGGNAQKAGLDSEVEVAEREGLRVARMTRDKSGPEGSAEWYFLLHQMDEVKRAKDIAAPAVCVPTDPATHKPFIVDAGWADDLAVEIPKVVYDLQGHGKAVAVQVFRILRWVGGDMGLTRSELSRAILDHRRQLDPKAKLTPDQLGRALSLLTKHHIIEPAAGVTARFVLTAAYATEDGDGTVLG